MEAEFTQREDGVIEIHLTSRWRALEETLQDAVTTRAPRGSDGVNPSTYWIDNTLAALDTAVDGNRVACGNMTDLICRSDDLVAHSQYDLFDDQPVGRAEVVDLLERWRTIVLDAPRSSPSSPSSGRSAARPSADLSKPGPGRGPVESPHQ